MRILAILLALFALGGLAPPRALPQPYRLVCSYFDVPRASVYQIDESGLVTLEQNLTVGNDSYRVTVAPDGRSFFVAQDYYTVSDLTPGSLPPWFFINSSGTIERAVSGPRPAGPSVYSPSGVFCFSGAGPCQTLELLHSSKEVIETDYHSQPFPSVGQNSLGYSKFGSTLVWAGTTIDFVQSIPVGWGGELGDPSELFYFANKGSNRDMDVSPDGRFVTVLGLDAPQLAVIGVRSDGSFHSVQNLLLSFSTFGDLYRLRYTPDGRFLLVVSSHYQHFLTCFRVDPETGALSQTGYANSLGTLGGWAIDALAITPDSRFAVLPNGDFTGATKMTFMVFRINDDGTLTRITQTRNDFPGYVSDMDFIPPYREPVTAASTGWMLYQ